MTETNTDLIDQIALQTRLIRSIQTDISAIRLQYTQTKSCDSYERGAITDAINKLSQSTSILSDLVIDYRTVTSIKTRKYYAVTVGLRPGIYTDYAAAYAQIDGVPNRAMQGFDSFAEAKRHMESSNASRRIEARPLDQYSEDSSSESNSSSSPPTSLTAGIEAMGMSDI